MPTPGPADAFREQDLPVTIRLGRMPRWLGGLVGSAALIAAAGGLLVAVVVNARDPDLIGDGGGVAIILGGILLGVFGGMLWWFSGVWLTLSSDEAVITKAYVFRRRVPRQQLEDCLPYLHSYATRSGMQYRMVPTLTVADRDGRLRDVPMQFLAWNPKRKQGAQPTPRAAYLEAWAKAGNSPYAYAARTGRVPDEIAAHRQGVRSGLRRRTLIVAISTIAGAVAIVGLTVGASAVWRAVHPAPGTPGAAAVDATSDRAGIRDLPDSLTPSFTDYTWTERPLPQKRDDVTFWPGLTTMPPAGYTLDYFVRDPAQRSGAGLSGEERKYGAIVARGTVSAPGEPLEFALEHGDTRFTFELYVTDAKGRTSQDANMWQDIGGPAAPRPRRPCRPADRPTG